MNTVIKSKDKLISILNDINSTSCEKFGKVLNNVQNIESFVTEIENLKINSKDIDKLISIFDTNKSNQELFNSISQLPNISTDNFCNLVYFCKFENKITDPKDISYLYKLLKTEEGRKQIDFLETNNIELVNLKDKTKIDFDKLPTNYKDYKDVLARYFLDNYDESFNNVVAVDDFLKIFYNNNISPDEFYKLSDYFGLKQLVQMHLIQIQILQT